MPGEWRGEGRGGQNYSSDEDKAQESEEPYRINQEGGAW